MTCVGIWQVIKAPYVKLYSILKTVSSESEPVEEVGTEGLLSEWGLLLSMKNTMHFQFQLTVEII